MRTDLVLDFADDKYSFQLSAEGMLELQEQSKAGFGAIFARVCAGMFSGGEGEKLTGFPLDAQFHLQDILQTIRLGLIGGGLEAGAAKKLVVRYCYPAQPLKPTWELAAAILLASMEGYEVKPPVEDEPIKKKATRSRTRKAVSTPQ